MDQRAANIRHNAAALKAAGLDDESFRAFRAPPPSRHRTTTTTASRRPAVVSSTSPPRRVSSRVRKVPPQPSSLDALPNEQFTPKRKKIRKKQEVVVGLTDEERSQLREQVDWLEEMEAYLKDEENLSYQNHRSVMRQVEKLVTGQGITYHHWGKETYFGKGTRITLSDNFDSLYEEACDFEDEHGKDLGNGTCWSFC